MEKITKLELGRKHKKLRKKHMNKGVLSATKDDPQKKSLDTLLKQTNPLVLISFGLLCLVAVVLVVSLVSLIILNKHTQQTGTQANNAQASIDQSKPVMIATPTPTPTPTPVPFPIGPQIYTVSSPDRTIIVKQLYISALDTKIGEPVTMKLAIQDIKSVINSVTVKIITDNKSQSPDFSLKSGTPNDGSWEGTWVTDDTHGYNYQAKITITDASGNIFSGTPTFR